MRRLNDLYDFLYFVRAVVSRQIRELNVVKLSETAFCFVDVLFHGKHVKLVTFEISKMINERGGSIIDPKCES